MKIDILTLFPNMCENFISESIIFRARQKEILDIKCHQIRDFATDRHHSVDDAPYGGGHGMLMLADPIAKCYENICNFRQCRPKFLYMSPKGKVLTQNLVKELSTMDNIAILCGHYEGIDQRVIDAYVDEQISIGDYVLTGGELPAMVLVDSICRLVPGVLSDEQCFTEESHYNGLLEYPQYTRPQIWNNMSVPEVLLSGHHANIERWRYERSVEETRKFRPDLIEN